MQRDPEDLFELSTDRPDLDGVPLLHHLEGFMDAGSAGRLLAEHLTSTCEPETVASATPPPRRRPPPPPSCAARPAPTWPEPRSCC